MPDSKLGLLAFVIILLSFPLLWLYQDSSSRNIMLDQEQAMALSQARQRHAELSEQILSNRSDFSQNYDALSDIQGKADKALRALTIALSSPAIISGSELKELNQLHQQRLADIEHFKSLNSKLRNSLRYLPALRSQIIDKLKTGTDHQLTNTLNDSTINLISDRLFADEDLQKKSRQQLAWLKNAPAGNRAAQADINNFIFHGELLYQFKQQEQQLLNRILNSKIQSLFSHIDQKLDHQHGLNIHLAERLKFFLIFYAAILGVLVILFLINRYHLHRHLKQQKDLSEKDQLTGLNNRRYFLNQLEAALQCKHDCFSAVIFIDLDGFKAINDQLGHNAGDEVLKILSATMQEYCEIHTDKSVTLARLGGDEFVILLDELDAEDTAGEVHKMAGEIVRLLSRPLQKPYSDFPLSASLGVAIFPDHGNTAIEIMHCADKAMYESKRHGKNTYTVFSENS